MGSRNFIQFLILFCFVLPFVSCTYNNSSNKHNNYDNLKLLLKDGDLLFRRGTGVAGHFVTAMDNEGKFSHVGIVVNKDSGWFVIHAVPNEREFDGDFDRVKCEYIDSFLDRYPNCDIGLYRPEVEQEKIATAVRNAIRLSIKQVPFDHDYNLEDTTKLYCTEMVEYVYSLAGVSISEGRCTEITFPMMQGFYIMPSDFTKNNILTHIY